MTADQHSRAFALFSQLFAARWSGSVAGWCESNLRFNEPKLSGPFSFHGRTSLREMLDSWSDENLKDLAHCMGTRTGKTRVVFGAIGWKVKNAPSRILYTMPNTTGT